MGDNLADFNRKLLAVSKELSETQVILAQKKIAFDAMNRIALKMPVDTGRARGNWQVGIDSSNENEVANAEDKSVADIMQDVQLAISQVKRVGQTVILFNNVPYIIYLEQGHSKAQAPNGMVAITVEELSGMFYD